MNRGLSLLLCGGISVVLWAPLATLSADEPGAARGTVIAVVEGFDDLRVGPFQDGFLDWWRWTDEARATARKGSRLEVADAPTGDGNKLLRVLINDPQVLAGEPLAMMRLAPFYPPEADALRIRMQVVSGQAVIHVGGPTAYYGNSDVYTEPQTIRAADPPRWVDVICNFNHPTWRNFRRAGFSTDAPRNYYNRWAQEPTGVFLSAGTAGEFLIDRIEVLALGEGKPFATFAPEQIQPIKTIADFENGRRDGTFNLYMANTETEWFDQSYLREKPLRFEPMQLAVVAGGLDGRRSLACTGRTAEEVHCTGVETDGEARANAFAMTVAVDAPEQRNTLVGAGPILPLDILVFVAPTVQAFSWERFGPRESLPTATWPVFDYQFSYRTIRDNGDVDFAIYQTRRYVEPGKWTKLVLPAADFTCVYGHGSFRRRLLNHEPLSCDDVIAVAWLNPWCRVGRRDSPITTRIDALSFVHVPGTPEEHCSFWQVPDVKSLRQREGTSPRGRTRHITLPGDATPN